MPENTQKTYSAGVITAIVVVALLVGALVAGASIYVWQQQEADDQAAEAEKQNNKVVADLQEKIDELDEGDDATTDSQNDSSSASVPAGWTSTTENSLTFYHPENWQAVDAENLPVGANFGFEEPDGIRMIVHQDTTALFTFVGAPTVCQLDDDGWNAYDIDVPGTTLTRNSEASCPSIEEVEIDGVTAYIHSGGALGQAKKSIALIYDDVSVVLSDTRATTPGEEYTDINEQIEADLENAVRDFAEEFVEANPEF